MPIKQQTVWPTEADFEADLQSGLRRVFPWLPPGSIRHQTKFSFQFGRSKIEVDGRATSGATARADVLLHSGSQALAVLELKRAGHALDESDTAQGLSYARMLRPSPPLVVVTNGNDLVLLETHTGQEWKPTESSETEFARLIKSAATAAASDLKQAISTLMGSNPGVWMQAVRQISRQTAAEFSGQWDEPLLPFKSGFLIPRKATAIALYLLSQNKRLVLVEGPPLIGKSNLLFELMRNTEESEDLAVLFLEAESGAGVLQTIATTLANSLSWPVTRDEARDWLLRLSKASGPSLVLAIDGLGTDRNDIRQDVEDLSSHFFGSQLRIVVTLDDSVADHLVLNSTGRKPSAIGRRAARVRLDQLDDDEFKTAAELLEQHRMLIMNGGQHSRELRLPWVLRAIASRIVSHERYQNSRLAAGVPPMLGLELIEHARERFQDHELRRTARATAQAVLHDADDRTRPIGLILESMATYTVRRKTLLKFLEHGETEKLIQQGFLRPILHESGEAVLVVRLPELVASEAADLLGIELSGKAETDATDAARWLASKASAVPLGDIVAAQALVDAAFRHGSLPLNIIKAFIDSPPKRKILAAGTVMAMHFPGVGLIDMTVQEGGSILLQAQGKRHELEADATEEGPVTYENFHGWLILSHLASRPFAIDEPEEMGARVDPMILLEVGCCPIVLRAVENPLEMGAILTHELPDSVIVCEKSGIVEPITLSIFWFMAAANELAREWLEEAAQRNSFPLLSRILIALDELAGSSDTQKSDFARQALKELIRPALSAFPLFH
ncbi:MAG: hypothetical protein WCC21_03045 [Candidatus Acidiferrales bacterium]